jgi:hypothetical protein
MAQKCEEREANPEREEEEERVSGLRAGHHSIVGCGMRVLSLVVSPLSHTRAETQKHAHKTLKTWESGDTDVGTAHHYPFLTF